jgi:hypothetical protein
MPKLKSGTNVYCDGLRFEYITNAQYAMVRVFNSESTHNLVTAFTVDPDRMHSSMDLEMQAMFWLADNSYKYVT